MMLVADIIQRCHSNMKDNGVLIGKTGANRNVLAFQPSLIINEDNINELIDVLDGALSYVVNQQK